LIRWGNRAARAAALCASVSLVACDGASAGDAATLDAALPDAATLDAALPDAATLDAALPDATAPDAALPDAALLDAALPDAAPPDATTPDAAAPDAAVPACDFPAPRLGDAAEARALAAAPARCGQPAHAWLEDPSLGEVTGDGDVARFPAALLQAVFDQQGIPVPRPIAHDVVVRQIAYTTQDRGAPITATALVAMPANLPAGASPTIVLVLHGTTGFNDSCAASETLEWRALAAFWASLGYVAVAPDYIGMRAFGEPTGFPHPYLVGQPTAIASLDAVRAVGRMAAAGDLGDMCPAPRVALFGGSQGGHAALWVDRLAPYYAPELEMLGGAATVPPADLLGEIDVALTSFVDATANTLAYLATAAPWYGHGDRLGEVLTPAARELADLALTADCGEDVDVDLDRYDELAEVYTGPLLDAVAADALMSFGDWGCMIAENGLTTSSIPRLGTDAPSYGLLFVVGSDDDLVHTPTERRAFESLCASGTPLEFLECAGASHSRATFWALPEIVRFVDARAAGEPFTTPACAATPPVRCEGTPADR
jgi:hypothetical protein